MLQYDCSNLISAFFKKHPVKDILASNDSKSGCSRWYTEDIIELLLKYTLEEELEKAGALSVTFINNGKRGFSSKINIYALPYQEKIVSSKTLSKEFKLKYLKGLKGSEIVALLISLLKKEDKDNFTWLCEWVQKLNAVNYTKLERAKQEKQGCYMTTVSSCDYPCQEYECVGTSDRYSYFIIYPTVELVHCLIDAGYIEYAQKANAQEQVLSEEEFQLAILKKDGKGDSEEALLLSVLTNGILNIDALLEFKDFKFIKKVLLEFPIHQFEILAKWFLEKNWRELFRFAVDNNDNNLSGSIVKEDVAQIEKALFSYWKSSALNGKHYCIIENGVKKMFFNTYSARSTKGNTTEEILSLLQRCRQSILDEFSLKMDKEKTAGELTREYFENLLAKGDVEMLIIKLCVRLEAILRCDYHYEGDFSEMLSNYCSKFNTYDDEGKDYDPHTPRLLHKLRMNRNGIVHSEKCKEALTVDEIKFCIDHICKMG